VDLDNIYAVNRKAAIEISPEKKICNPPYNWINLKSMKSAKVYTSYLKLDMWKFIIVR